ncbi:ATP-binding protein [Luteibacter aegosomaticola]|uniref:hybrid sensor histidine kinase/response regulator n=1 Tax=Luteibacter aegosomaticola TaxID=2911538 RepID=UPI001FFADA9A|nr:ATP-binding protein [Luteibacter aegosomaticola]UPG92334.1 ATP-binding protein [Luteibacter aegosomaticola]
MRWFAGAILACLAPLAFAVDTPPTPSEWAAAHPVVRIAIDDQQGGRIGGQASNPLVTQYLALAQAKTGLRFVVVHTSSWEESVAAFKAGRIDLLPSLTDRLVADLGSDALWSRPFYVGHTLLITRTVGPARVTLADLDGRTIAYKGGGEYDSWLRRSHPSIHRLPLADVHQVLAAVESGIADAGLGIDVTYHPIVRRDYGLSLRIAGDIPEMPVSVRLAVHKDAPQLLTLIDESLGRISVGENEAVIERWLETAYLRAPTVAHIASVYRVEIALGVALAMALVFALWQMRRAQLASRRGEQQKTLLLAVMSHEVRNAVNAVTSSIELMARAPMDGAQRDLMAIAQSSARNLQGMLRSALDYTRTEAEGFTPDLAACDALAVAREVLQGHAAAIEQKGLAVRLDLPMGALPWLLLDETRLRQVLENLLSNAVKFTDRGHVGIALWQVVDGDAPRRLVFEVFDTGAGISVERRRGLFRPFVQAHGRRSRRLGGTGLGLGICREIVNHLGGRLVLSSEEGVGTSVRVELPTSLVPSVPVVEPAAADSAASHGGVVLLVEDHPANRQIIAAQLRFLGFETMAADHGQAAIDAFEPGKFAAVLLDCELPDMQGYDIAAELRARERRTDSSRTPFIAISATQGEEHIQRCNESGIDIVMGKPLSLDRLREALSPPAHEDDVFSLFRAEGARDLDAALAAAGRGDVTAARQSLHRVHGAALVLRLTQLEAPISAVTGALAGDPLNLDRHAKALREALAGVGFTAVSQDED